MRIFLYLGSRRGYAVLKTLIAEKADIAGILCLVEDPHEAQFHPKVSALAKENNIPLFYSTEITSAKYSQVLQKIKPDIALAIGWRYLITKEAYEIPPKGTLIIHDSLLPTYRGFAPMNWAIINGEKYTGVTLFYIAEGVDCGAIVDQMKTEITLIDNAKTVDEKIIKLYEAIVIKNLPLLAHEKIKAIPQNEASATYTCKRTPEDGEINWQQSALQIYNLIRGLTHPFPGAYSTLRGKRILIWGATLPLHHPTYIGNIPGRIIGKQEGKIAVLTGNGVLQLTHLQFIDEEEKEAINIPISVKDTFGR